VNALLAAAAGIAVIAASVCGYGLGVEVGKRAVTCDGPELAARIDERMKCDDRRLTPGQYRAELLAAALEVGWTCGPNRIPFPRENP